MSRGKNAISKTGEYNAHITNPELVKLIKLCAKEKGLETINYIVQTMTNQVKLDIQEIDKGKLVELFLKRK